VVKDFETSPVHEIRKASLSRVSAFKRNLTYVVGLSLGKDQRTMWFCPNGCRSSKHDLSKYDEFEG
jgi:hypothetical protein